MRERHRRDNHLAFLSLPWAQEVWNSNLHAPTIIICKFFLRILTPAGVRNGACSRPRWRHAPYRVSRQVEECGRLIYSVKSSSVGGRSSAGRASDCGSECRGFKSHRPPQLLNPFTVDLRLGIVRHHNVRHFLYCVRLRFLNRMRVGRQCDAWIAVTKLRLHRGWACSQIDQER